MSARRTLMTASLGTVAVLVAFTAPLANINETVAGPGCRPPGWHLGAEADERRDLARSC